MTREGQLPAPARHPARGTALCAWHGTRHCTQHGTQHLARHPALGTAPGTMAPGTGAPVFIASS